MTTRLHITDQPSDADRDAIRNGLSGFNEVATGLFGHSRLDLGVLVRDESRSTIGGALGGSSYGWMVIDLLWLPQALRRDGLGRQVMLAAEREAMARHCIGIRLDTFSFQARGFYEKLGYSVFGTLPDHPPGHTRYWLAKRFETQGAP